jgi:hypothetical protein
MSKLFKRALGVEHTVIEDIRVHTDTEGQEALVLSGASRRPAERVLLALPAALRQV